MEIKKTSSGAIKTFAKVMFVIGIILSVIAAIALAIAGLQYSRGSTLLSVLTIVGATVFLVLSILLLIVEKAFLLSYAEIAEDMREVRNILAKRDSSN